MRVHHDFFLYPDPDQRFLKRIRIRIRANDTDPKHWVAFCNYPSIYYIYLSIYLPVCSLVHYLFIHTLFCQCYSLFGQLWSLYLAVFARKHYIFVFLYPIHVYSRKVCFYINNKLFEYLPTTMTIPGAGGFSSR